MDVSKRNQLDKLLTYGAEALDLTPTQYKDAVQKYQAVGTWLSKTGTLLAEASPQIYPQGSIAIGTATKPVGKNEFDLDIVCQLQIGNEMNPAALKRAVGKRLRENVLYHERLEEKNRCWRITYAGDFHMDILPSRPDPQFICGTALLVPDKDLADWKETDPKGYAAWFDKRSGLSILVGKDARADVETPPPSPQTSTKTPLQLAVQILKRHRDLSLGDDKDAPISIIITTLAARAYAGQNSVFDTLHHLILRMPSFIETDAAGKAVVQNPVNSLENFADKWHEEPKKKKRFYEWLRAAKHDLDQLSSTSLSNAAKALTPLVGERASSEAVRRYGANVHDQRTTGLTGLAATGALGVTSTQARTIPQQTFFGRDS